MDFAAVLAVEFAYAIANLFLISAGLAVVFGMMRVINLAHGEFMMLGGYATIVAVNAGINVFVAMLLVAPLFVGLFGLACERLVIQHLYGRLIDTMLASWGLSLLIIGVVTMIFGNTTTGIPTPIPGFRIGGYQVNGYNLFVIVVVVILIGLMFCVLKWTHAGLIARGTMQGAEMSSALGHNTARIYMATFFAGSALAGLAGGRACSAGRPGSCLGRSIYRQGIHRGHRRGAVGCRRPSGRFDDIRFCRTVLHFRRYAGDRRGSPSRCGHLPPPAPAEGNNRQVPEGVPVMSGSASRALAAATAVGLVAMLVLPFAVDTYTLTVLAIYGMLALSLGLVWGYGGILCFGQSAFFGLGAYAYAVATINVGESTLPVLVGVLVPALTALLLGAMMFFGRLTDVYLGVVTLVFTLILNRLLNSTAGPEYVIGKARLGGVQRDPGFPHPECSRLPGCLCLGRCIVLCVFRWR